MAAHLKKLAAAAIQCAAIILAPSYENWLGFLPWIFIVFGFLVVDIEKSGNIEPKSESNTILIKEGSQLSLILYFKKQRKSMIYIHPVGHWQKLMTYVHKITNSENLTKVAEKFEIEPFD